MASVRYIILAACQNAGLYAQAGWESEAAAWIEKQGDRPCAYVYYRQGVGVAGFDNVSVAFGGSNPSAALRRVRDSLERSLEFRSERQTEIGGFPVLAVTARAKKRVYGFGGVVRPIPPVPPTPTVDYMYFEAVEANSTVAMTSTLTTAPNLEYSTDGETWQEWQHTTADSVHTFDTITLTAIGDRVYLRGDNPNGLGTLPEGTEMPLFSHFDMTGKIAAGGNIMSLLDKNVEMTEVPTLGLVMLFGDTTGENHNTSLTTPAGMPSVTNIGNYGCNYMYYGCTSLTSAAAMPAVTSISYGGCNSMYAGCTSLTSSAAMPVLTNIGNYGCNHMYYGCTSLTSSAAMPLLTRIDEDGCDSMYDGCTSLTAAAAMPVLTLINKEGCSHMYYGCTSLTAAAAMPAVTSIGFGGCNSMYAGCTSLTSTAAMPVLTLINVEGCSGMYAGCTSLTAAAAMPSLTTIGDNGCESMYSGCTFNMSNDGTALNFDFPTPPITAGETTYPTAYDVAQWMGNTNGFTEP